MLGRFLRLVPLFLLVTVAVAETIPAGTHLTARIDSQISSGTAKVGQRFDGNLTKDLVVKSKTLAKAGAPVYGKVTYVKTSGRLHEPGEVSIRLTSVEINGKLTALSTSAFRAKGKSHTKSNATKIGGAQRLGP